MPEKKNFFQRLFSRKKEEQRAFIPGGTFTPMSAVFGETFERSVTNSGALRQSAVYACVSKISDSIASMDVCVEKKNPDGSTEKLYSHPVTRMLSVEPNRLMGSYEFWQMVVSDALIYGTGHAIIMHEEEEMYWLPAGDVSYTVDPESGEKFYTYPGAPNPIPQADMLEIKAFRSLSPTKVHEQTLFTNKSIQDFGSTFFQNGGMLGGILSTKEYMTADQIKEATALWKQEYMGSKNAHKVAILGGGFNYQPLSVPLEQLQWLESKKYSAEEIARFYQVPPSMVGLDSQTAYSNYEQQVLQFNQGTIMPWLRRIELEIERKVLRNNDRLACRFNVESLLRGDLSTRAEYYHRLLQDGVYSINEVRSREGMSPIEGGDENLVQLNQIPVSSISSYADSIVADDSGDDSRGKQSGMADNDNEESTGVNNQVK